MIIAWFDPEAKTLLRIFGGTIIFLAVTFLLIAWINLSNQNPLVDLIDEDFRGNENSYLYFMPFLFIIGLSYLMLGLRLPKPRIKALIYHILISIFLIIWIICWVLFNDHVQETSTELTRSTGTITNSIYLIPFLIIIILIPQIIIGSKLYTSEKVHKGN